jgi:transposase
MTYGAIDLHARYSQVRVIDGEGRVLRDQKIVTNRDRLVAVFAPYGPIRILLESSTESEWVAVTLEEAGHEVVVADPNFAPMYGERHRRVRTDRRDVAALADANRHGWYRPAYRRSSAQRVMAQQLRVRRQLVQMRTGMISVVRAILRQSGYRVATGTSARIAARISALALPESVQAIIEPLRRGLEMVTAEIRAVDRQLESQADADAITRRLQTVPGVGPIVALTFRAFVDNVHRFQHAGQVSAAIGLVPREDSSGERCHRGHISKSGPTDLRSLLVQAAWSCWRTRRSGSLRDWANQLAARRGSRIAVTALARRLSRILFAIWRDEAEFAMPARIAA